MRARRCSSSPTSPGSRWRPKSAMRQILSAVPAGRCGQSVDFAGQVEVPLRQPARAVCRQFEPQRSPADVDVGMMVARLSLAGDPPDQLDRRLVRGALDYLIDVTAVL